MISNPLGEDTSVMRTTALPSMLDVVSRNYNNRNLSEAFFELAKVYEPRGTEELPNEKMTLVLAEYGEGRSYYTLKGKLEAILAAAGVKDYDVAPLKTAASYHPGRTAILTVDGRELAVLGEIHPDVLENYGVGVKVWAAQVDLDLLFAVSDTNRVYRGLPRFPALTRDLAFVVDRSVPVLTIEKLMKQAVGETLEHIELFDVFEDPLKIGPGRKSVAFALRLRGKDRTLTDEEANEAVTRAISAAAAVGAALRA